MMDSKTLLPLLKKNDNIDYDSWIKKRLQFLQARLGYVIEIPGAVLTAPQVLDVIHVINYLKRHNVHNVSLSFRFMCLEIADKLVYVLLEDLFYYFVQNINCKLELSFPCLKRNILAEGIQYSALSRLSDKGCFCKSYMSDIFLRHYRKILSYDNSSGSALSVLNQDMAQFFMNNGIKAGYSAQLSEVITEISGNACEHGESDCILDVDVTESYQKEDDPRQDYYGVNVTIVNYSQHLFHDLLMSKMESNPYPQGRYATIATAKENHSSFWKNEEYTEEDFYMISSFQHKISGSRRKPQEVGGTGLTMLIKSLEDYSDSNKCYLLTGKRCFLFEARYLRYDQNKFIGFNQPNDYIHVAPERSLLVPCCVFFPGSAFNLHFVLKK